MLEWHGRGNLVDTHKEKRIISGKEVEVTVCKPAEAAGSNWSMSWDERIKIEVEESDIDEEQMSEKENRPLQCSKCEKMFKSVKEFSDHLKVTKHFNSKFSGREAIGE